VASILFSSGPPDSAFRRLAIEDAAKDYLERCRKALAKFTGPMAIVYVKEEVVAIATNGEFKLKDVPRVVQELEKRLKTEDERREFRGSLG
jgi:hypothetical protein